MSTSQQGAVTTIRVNEMTTGWEQWILLVSDQHHDSVQCNREVEKEQLDEAKRRNAWIFMGGDLFDAMQGRFDPRRSMAELRPEYRRDDYYDFVVKDITDFLLPYKDNIKLIADGNHELAVLKNANTNLADRLVSNLRLDGSECVHGGYGGWVVFLLEHGTNGPRFSKRLKYFHGAGGEAPVTRGVIQTNRQAVYLPDADVVWNGHNHQEYIIPICRERITTNGFLYSDICWHIRTPGYKQGYADGSGGWEVTRGGVPKPIGAVWLRLSFKWGEGQGNNHNGTVTVTPSEDIRCPEMISPAGDMYSGPVYDEDDYRQE